MALRTALIVPGVHTSDTERTARFALPAHLQLKTRCLLAVSVLCHVAVLLGSLDPPRPGDQPGDQPQHGPEPEPKPEP